MKKVTILLIALMVISVGFLSGCTEQTSTSVISEKQVYLQFQECVKEALIAPATAQFPSIDEAKVVKKNANTWAVISYVDAQNTYGALIRKCYGYELCVNEGIWSLLSMDSGNSESDVDHVLYKWVFIDSFSSGDEGTTEDFYIAGERWRLDWRLGGKQEYSDFTYFWVTPFRSSDKSDVGFISGDYGETGTTYIKSGEDSFYLTISASNLQSWSIEIYEGFKMI